MTGKKTDYHAVPVVLRPAPAGTPAADRARVRQIAKSCSLLLRDLLGKDPSPEILYGFEPVRKPDGQSPVPG